MGFFDRISNVWKGKVAAGLSELERRNPEAVYEAAIAARERSFGELKRAASGLARLRDETREALEAARRELARVLPGIELAAAEGDGDSALVLARQREALEARIAALDEELEGLSARAAEAVEDLRTYREAIDALRRERDQALASRAGAAARIRAQEALSGLSEDADIRALAGVRAHIERLDAVAPDEGARRGVEEAGERAARSGARAELEAMKAQLAARRSGVARTLGGPAAGEEGPEEPAPPADEIPERTL